MKVVLTVRDLLTNLKREREGDVTNHAHLSVFEHVIRSAIGPIMGLPNWVNEHSGVPRRPFAQLSGDVIRRATGQFVGFNATPCLMR